MLHCDFQKKNKALFPIFPPHGGGDTGVVDQCQRIFEIDIFIRLRNISNSISSNLASYIFGNFFCSYCVFNKKEYLFLRQFIHKIFLHNSC